MVDNGKPILKMYNCQKKLSRNFKLTESSQEKLPDPALTWGKWTIGGEGHRETDHSTKVSRSGITELTVLLDSSESGVLLDTEARFRSPDGKYPRLRVPAGLNFTGKIDGLESRPHLRANCARNSRGD